MSGGPGILARIGRTASTILSALWAGAVRLVLATIAIVEDWLLDSKKAEYGIAVTRILMGVTGLGLLATHFNARSYVFGPASAWNGEMEEPNSDFPAIWLFSWFHRVAGDLTLFTLLYLVLAVLAVTVILGWRTKIILPVYFVLWVSFIEVNDSAGDQGDNAYRIFLLSMLFADTARRLSLDARRRDRPVDPEASWISRKWNGERLLPEGISTLAHNLVLVVMTFQVSFIYVSGALYKAGGEPWAEGRAVYDPLMVDQFSTWPELAELLTRWGPGVAMISWGSIILQMFFPLMLLARPTRIVALIGIMSFHAGIGLLMGLPWFSLAMVAVDAIFIRDRTWRAMAGFVRKAWTDSGAEAPAGTGDAKRPGAGDTKRSGTGRPRATRAGTTRE